MSATGFYGFAVEWFVFAGYAYSSNLSICYYYRTKREGKDNHSINYSKHIINDHTFTGQFKQWGIVTENCHRKGFQC